MRNSRPVDFSVGASKVAALSGKKSTVYLEDWRANDAGFVQIIRALRREGMSFEESRELVASDHSRIMLASSADAEYVARLYRKLWPLGITLIVVSDGANLKLDGRPQRSKSMSRFFLEHWALVILGVLLASKIIRCAEALLVGLSFGISLLSATLILKIFRRPQSSKESHILAAGLCLDIALFLFVYSIHR